MEECKDFGFTLNFEELDEELQEQKITEVIDHRVDTGEFDDRELRPGDILDDEDLRREVRVWIRTHFPICF